MCMVPGIFRLFSVFLFMPSTDKIDFKLCKIEYQFTEELCLYLAQNTISDNDNSRIIMDKKALFHHACWSPPICFMFLLAILGVDPKYKERLCVLIKLTYRSIAVM